MEIKKITNLELIENIISITKVAYGNLPWTEKQFYEDFELERTCYYGGFIDGKLIGYIHLSFNIDDYEVLNLAVEPKCQGQGYGLKLLNFVLGEYQDKPWLLEVRESNKKALALYQKLGFRILSKRTKYYNHPIEDALIMIKEKDDGVEK